jgi:hypothetical protein
MGRRGLFHDVLTDDDAQAQDNLAQKKAKKSDPQVKKAADKKREPPAEVTRTEDTRSAGSSHKKGRREQPDLPPPAVPIFPDDRETKARVCKGCDVEYVFFPDHPNFNELPAEWVCMNCIDKVVCFGCGQAEASRDQEMIMCDGCLLRGAHFPCLGLPDIPEGGVGCTLHLVLC